MKTAIIETYQPFGTRSAVCVEVMYRGSRLKTFTGPLSDRHVFYEKAKAWAKTNGFTHFRDFGGKPMSL